MLYVKAYICALAMFLIMDFLWLGVVAQDFYTSQLGGLMREKTNFLIAALFYVAFVGGIVYFAIVPALAQGSWQTAALNGALLGLLAYGAYDLTNLATLKDWPVAMSLVDMVWGAVVTSSSAVAGFAAARVFSAA